MKPVEHWSKNNIFSKTELLVWKLICLYLTLKSWVIFMQNWEFQFKKRVGIRITNSQMIGRIHKKIWLYIFYQIILQKSRLVAVVSKNSCDSVINLPSLYFCFISVFVLVPFYMSRWVFLAFRPKRGRPLPKRVLWNWLRKLLPPGSHFESMKQGY